MQNKLTDKDRSFRISRGPGRFAALLLFLVCASLATAQLDTGTISGAVTDQSGAAVPGANVTIRNVETGVSRAAQTGATGRYEAIALPVGNYEVSAALTGFQTLVRSGINLTVGRNAVVDMVLQVGEVTQTVTVTGEASYVETTTATVTNLVDEKRVLDIPLNNRDLTQLAFFQPGVLRIPAPEGGTRTQKEGQGVKFSVAGSRGQQNIYLVDGVSNSDMSGNAQTAGGAYAGAETVKEFQVITNNYSAEYQSKPGAIISAVTKSGTNSFHGSLYEFLRNDNLDAAKWEDNAFGGAKPEFKRNHFGGSLGGPIFRDKTFFFVSYEGMRERVSTTETYTVPTAEGRIGNLGLAERGPVNPIVVPFLSLYPLPGQGNSFIENLPLGRALVGAPQGRPVNEDFGNIKVDHQFASERKGFLAFTYNINDSTQQTMGLLPNNDSRAYFTRKYVMSAKHTSILSPTLLNEFAFGYTDVTPRGDIPTIPVDWKNVLGVDLRFNPDKENMGDIGGNELSPIGYENDGSKWTQKVWTFRDSVSLTRPNHTIKFGTEVQYFQHPIQITTGNDNGNYGFNSFADFLQGQPNRLQVDLPKGAIVLGQPALQIRDYDIRQTVFGFYFQDNWKVLPSLTLNLGLRYEFMTLPTDTSGNLAALRNLQDSRLAVGPIFNNPTKKDFSPRFGFAWSPGDHRTSVRGGFGIYYDMPTLYHWNTSLGEMPPFSATGSAEDNDAVKAGTRLRFPDAFTTQPLLLASTPNLRTYENNAKPVYVYRWSLTLERELGPWFFSGGYTGARARHLVIMSDANMNRWIGWPNNVPTDQKHWAPVPPALVNPINPTFANIWVQSMNGNMYYHGLTVNVLRRLTRGLQVQAAYTLSKSLSQGDNNANGSGLIQNTRISYYWDMDHRLGRSMMDIRNNFVSNATFDFPATSLTGIGGALLNGWQVNGIVTLSDGYPVDIRDTNTAQRNALRREAGIRPNLIPGGNNDPVLGTPSAGKDRYYDTSQFIPSTCRGGVYCYTLDSRGRSVGQPGLGFEAGYFGNLARDTVTAPGLVTFDFSTVKNFRLTEQNRVQFRAEFFNLFNRPNYSIPDITPFLSSGARDTEGGRITGTRTSAREIQFGLKFIF